MGLWRGIDDYVTEGNNGVSVGGGEARFTAVCFWRLYTRSLKWLLASLTNQQMKGTFLALANASTQRWIASLQDQLAFFLLPMSSRFFSESPICTGFGLSCLHYNQQWLTHARQKFFIDCQVLLTGRKSCWSEEKINSTRNNFEIGVQSGRFLGDLGLFSWVTFESGKFY